MTRLWALNVSIVFGDFCKTISKMNYLSNVNYNLLLLRGIKFSVDLAKKTVTANVTKAVSDRAVKAVKRVVFKKGDDKK